MKIAVIGAGASGLMAAVFAARNGASVTIYEHNSAPGRKLLLTGNGKCNLGNTVLTKEAYHSESDRNRFIEGFLSNNTYSDLIRDFESLGLLIRERDGLLYPYSEQGRSVLEVLLREVSGLKVDIRYSVDIYRGVSGKGNGFVIFEDYYDKLIICSGGKSFKETGSDGSGHEIAKKFGHSVIPLMPSLVQLYTDMPDFKDMSGIRVKAGIRYKDLSEYGEIQFTDRGISGIPVFQISGRVVRDGFSEKSIVHINFFADKSRDEVINLISNNLKAYRGNAKEKVLLGLLPDKIIGYCIKHGKPDFSSSESVYDYFCDFKVRITGNHSLQNAQVTSGGIPLYEIREDFSSAICENLYFAGEILDVDGKCGGYNLHFAFESGKCAGINASKQV